MSSSISSSDHHADHRAWARWLGLLAGTFALAIALVFAALIAIDPYDSGRFGLLGIDGVSDVNPNTAGASRARDPQFDAAIFGDSTGQLLKPGEFTRLTGRRFVQLTVPGAGPREQLAILDFFVRHHARIGAIVIAVDGVWCTRDAALPPLHPFPLWLYEAGGLEYAARLFSVRSLGRVLRRIQIGLGSRQRSAPDGYWDYEALGGQAFRPVLAPQPDAADFAGAMSEDFPAIAQLAASLGKLSADVPVVLVAPPVFHTQIPSARSRAAAEDSACKRGLQRVADARGRAGFIDYRVDSALTRDPANFKDYVHVGAKGARQMEREIAERIGAL